MHNLEHWSSVFAGQFAQSFFPEQPASLYDPSRYILNLGGKRIRPVLVYLGNELFDTVHADVPHAANALELFHNFSLIHDDIMDEAPLRRGKPTVHAQWGENTAILAGDVMLVKAYEELSKLSTQHLSPVLQLFNTTAKEVCEGQQLDMDYEKKAVVSLDEYVHMITLKTSVLIAAALKIGAILGGASTRNQNLIYNFGLHLGIAFQIQDDYLDAFGEESKTGKQVGGDILANKKTFLLIKTMETLNGQRANELQALLERKDPGKVPAMLELYRSQQIDLWAANLKEAYYKKAMHFLDEIAVQEVRKSALTQLSQFLIQRDY